MRETRTTYRDAGVDIGAGNDFVNLIKPLVKATSRPEVIADIGGFGGLFSLNASKYRNPVLVSGTDGVGTKLKLAFMADRHDSIGLDLVAMCVNDIVVQGAEPLFFLDYLATAKLDPAKAAQIVKGIADGCIQAGCALIGGETAEMPGFYANGEYDVAGFAVAVRRQRQPFQADHGVATPVGKPGIARDDRLAAAACYEIRVGRAVQRRGEL